MKLTLVLKNPEKTFKEMSKFLMKTAIPRIIEETKNTKKS